MLSYKLDFSSCATRDGFCKSSHKYLVTSRECYLQVPFLKVRSTTLSNVPFVSSWITKMIITCAHDSNILMWLTRVCH